MKTAAQITGSTGSTGNVNDSSRGEDVTKTDDTGSLGPHRVQPLKGDEDTVAWSTTSANDASHPEGPSLPDTSPSAPPLADLPPQASQQSTCSGKPKAIRPEVPVAEFTARTTQASASSSGTPKKALPFPEAFVERCGVAAAQARALVAGPMAELRYQGCSECNGILSLRFDGGVVLRVPESAKLGLSNLHSQNARVIKTLEDFLALVARQPASERKWIAAYVAEHSYVTSSDGIDASALQTVLSQMAKLGGETLRRLARFDRNAIVGIERVQCMGAAPLVRIVLDYDRSMFFLDDGTHAPAGAVYRTLETARSKHRDSGPTCRRIVTAVEHSVADPALVAEARQAKRAAIEAVEDDPGIADENKVRRIRGDLGQVGSRTVGFGVSYSELWADCVPGWHERGVMSVSASRAVDEVTGRLADNLKDDGDWQTFKEYKRELESIGACVQVRRQGDPEWKYVEIDGRYASDNLISLKYVGDGQFLAKYRNGSELMFRDPPHVPVGYLARALGQQHYADLRGLLKSLWATPGDGRMRSAVLRRVEAARRELGMRVSDPDQRRLALAAFDKRLGEMSFFDTPLSEWCATEAGLTFSEPAIQKHQRNLALINDILREFRVALANKIKAAQLKTDLQETRYQDNIAMHDLINETVDTVIVPRLAALPKSVKAEVGMGVLNGLGHIVPSAEVKTSLSEQGFSFREKTQAIRTALGIEDVYRQFFYFDGKAYAITLEPSGGRGDALKVKVDYRRGEVPPGFLARLLQKLLNGIVFSEGFVDDRERVERILNAPVGRH